MAQNPEPSTATRLIRRARDGEWTALDPVVAQMTPLLRIQAARRLGDRLCSHIDPDDIVQEAWMVALERLPDLESRNGSLGSVLFNFLGSTVLNLANNALRKVARERAAGATLEAAAAAARPVSPAASASQFLRRAIAVRPCEAVEALLRTLDGESRELVVLRLEGATWGQIAEWLGNRTADAARMQFGRILQRLRAEIPGGVFDEWDPQG